MLSPSALRTPEELAAEPLFIQWVQQPTPATNSYWQRWIAADADRPALVQKARLLVQVMQFESFPLHLTDQQRLERQLRQKLAERVPVRDESPQTRVVPLRQRTPSRWVVYGVAASLVAMLLVGFWFWQQRPATLVWDYATTYGQTRRIKLPDHSLVTLNANSRLRLAPGWRGRGDDESAPREVWIEGEAYFDIRKKPGTKAALFTVHSGRVNVTVLGTTFDLIQRRGTTQVVLSTGRVRLEGLPSGVQLMAPGDRIVYREKAALTGHPPVERSRVNPAHYTAWKQGEWVLDNTSLTEIATMLHDQFGLRVTFANPSLAERRLSGRMSIESPDVFLENLSTILGVSAQRTTPQTVLIRP